MPLIMSRVLVALSAFLVALASNAQTYPDRLIKLVVPYPPGASTDAVGRLIGQKMAVTLGQTVLIENRAGASGNLGSDDVAKAPADGYTLVLGTDATHAANYHLFKKLPFDPIKDFTPLTMVAKNIIVLVANPSLPVHNVKELIAYAKANPGKLAYGSSGNGSPHHLAGALFNQMAGTDIVHVPYKGGGPAVTDVLGGQIPLIYSSLVSVMPYIKAGKLTALAVTEKTRYVGLPDVPAMAEILPGFEMSSWLALFGPAGLPAPIVEKLNHAAVDALKSPDVKATLEAAGLVPVGNTPAQLAAQQKADFERRGKLIKSAGIEMD